MLALALELSTAHASLALFQDEELIGESAWLEPSARKAHLFEELPALFNRTGVEAAAIHTFVVGRGPGSYSGLRSAITAARALALPGGRAVYAVSSGEALAVETARREGGRAVAVVGNARRSMLWIGVYRIHGAGLEVMKPWTVMRAAELGEVLREPCTVVSPDWTQLKPSLTDQGLAHVRWIEEDRYPSAKEVGRLGLMKMGANQPSEALTPIYTHPPVG